MVIFDGDGPVRREAQFKACSHNGVTFPQTAKAVSRSDDISQGVDMGTVRLNYHF